MRRVALFVLFFSNLLAPAQSVDLGVFGGISNYQGDLVDKLFSKNFAKAAVGINAGYQLSEHWTVRGGVAFTKLTANDKYNTKTELQARNLNFNTSVTEFSLVGEYATFDLEQKRWTPYVFGGLSVFHFDPYTFDGANKLFLKPLSTEGQGLTGYQAKPYALTQLALPFGAGFRYAVNEKINLGLELGIRKLFTDHLDDLSGSYAGAEDLLRERGELAVAFAYRGDEVANGNPSYPQKGAQRGGSLQKDWYYLTGITLHYKLGGGNSPFARRGKRSNYGCPGSPL